MPLEWTDELATLDDKIDEQHKQLFRFANTLESLLEADSVAPAEAERLLLFMKTYAESHFHYEENCMRRYNCPFAHENREAHAAFSEFYATKANEYRKNGYDRQFLEALHEFVTNWLTNHICKIDRKLRDYH